MAHERKVDLPATPSPGALEEVSAVLAICKEEGADSPPSVLARYEIRPLGHGRHRVVMSFEPVPKPE